MSPFEVRFAPGLATLPNDHSALRMAEGELRADLHEAGADVREIPVTMANTKGWQTDLVLSLSGPAAIAGAVQVFRVWMSRDRRRTLTVSRHERQDGSTEVTIRGDAVSDETLRVVLEQALNQAPPPEDPQSPTSAPGPKGP
jgi:hypothetical protein